MADLTETAEAGCPAGKAEADRHGGDIYRHEVEVDFSVNVNPLGMPERVREALLCAVDHSGTYPEPGNHTLGRAIGHSKGVPEQWIVCGNGASELLMAVVHALRPRRTVIPVPSFYGYEHAVAAAGGETVFYPLREQRQFSYDSNLYEVLTPETELLFLANPNNPTGRLTDPGFLRELFAYCKRQKIRVVLDECFLELCGEEGRYSFLPNLGKFPNLMVLRAFTKTYAIPGVRLGYLACSDRAMTDCVRAQLPEWNLSLFAQRAGLAALGEQEYLARSVALIGRERKRLAEGVRGCGIQVYEGSACFLLLKSRLPLYQGLLQKGILIRDCANFRGLGESFYRIAVRGEADNQKLLREIWKCREQESGG